ncbi:hypothetical protein CUU64_14530 [Bacillus sp. V5-8f]|nr:hypothetical protein CUU64_14530 [Bacillus sp. V5-8f]
MFVHKINEELSLKLSMNTVILYKGSYVGIAGFYEINWLQIKQHILVIGLVNNSKGTAIITQAVHAYIYLFSFLAQQLGNRNTTCSGGYDKCQQKTLYYYTNKMGCNRPNCCYCVVP